MIHNIVLTLYLIRSDVHCPALVPDITEDSCPPFVGAEFFLSLLLTPAVSLTFSPSSGVDQQSALPILYVKMWGKFSVLKFESWQFPEERPTQCDESDLFHSCRMDRTLFLGLLSVPHALKKKIWIPQSMRVLTFKKENFHYRSSCHFSPLTVCNLHDQPTLLNSDWWFHNIHVWQSESQVTDQLFPETLNAK